MVLSLGVPGIRILETYAGSEFPEVPVLVFLRHDFFGNCHILRDADLCQEDVIAARAVERVLPERGWPAAGS